MKIIDNFLPENLFSELVDSIKNIPWFYTQGIGNLSSEDAYYFTHSFYRNISYCSNFLPVVQPILDRIESKAIIRIKGNLYLSTPSLQKHDFHVDEVYKHYGAVFYVNTNDGFTEFENDVKIDSVANRVVFFDPTVLHRSTNCTDKAQPRITINFNYL